jgi:hypothetical protein
VRRQQTVYPDQYLSSTLHNIDTFVDELSAVVDDFCQCNRRLLILGDFNCAGPISTSVDESVAYALAEFHLSVVNSEPTCYDRRTNVNMLDLIEPQSDQLLASFTTTPLAALFDHHSVAAQLHVKRAPVPLITFV